MVEDNVYEFSDRDCRLLCRGIERGQCILLIGPDVSYDVSDPAKTSLSKKLAQVLADDLSETERVVSRHDLAHVAQLYYLDKGRNDLELAVEDFYADYTDKTTPFHQALAGLPFRLCITTTPDRFLLNAFSQSSNKTPRFEYYDYRSGDVPKLPELNASKPLIYGLYGSIDDSQTLVMTENDLLDFLVRVIKGEPRLPAVLTSEFADKDKIFLFVGFGFYNWHLRILLHVLCAEERKNLSIAMEGARFFEHPDQSQCAVFFDNKHAIQFRRLSTADFTQKLCRHFVSERPKANQPQAVAESDAPTVFLCHASEDHEKVAELGQQLRDRGMKTWRDRDKLRGGDDGNARIRHVINNQIDYFLVVVTDNMHGLTESCFHREIKAALERQEGFDEGTTFVIPALVDTVEKMNRLTKLHHQNLNTADDLDQLVSSIANDWRKRKNIRRGVAA